MPDTVLKLCLVIILLSVIKNTVCQVSSQVSIEKGKGRIDNEDFSLNEDTSGSIESGNNRIDDEDFNNSDDDKWGSGQKIDWGEKDGEVTQKSETKSLDVDGWVWQKLADQLMKIPLYSWAFFFLQMVSFVVLLQFCCTMKKKMRDMTKKEKTIKIEYPQIDKLQNTIQSLESRLKRGCPGMLPLTVSY